jgi:hypothetical protein
VVVRVALQLEEEGVADMVRCVPTMVDVDWFVDSWGDLLSNESIVLNVIDRLKR